jgi:nucleotide-binding universal stress UspA family protein
VLCPVDFSGGSGLALRYAAHVARRAHATLTVLYVNDRLLIAAAAAALHDRDIVQRSRRELNAFVEDTLRGELPAGATGDIRVAVGDPVDEILKCARRVKADLLVVGTHGLSVTDRWFIGSTTLNLLRRTPLPVLAVPSGSRSADAVVPRAWPGPRIVAAVALDRRARHELGIATTLAGWFDTPLLVLHVVATSAAPVWLRGHARKDEPTRIGRAKRRLDRLISRSGCLVGLPSRVASGRPAHVIAAAAGRSGLVLTALKDRRGWYGGRRGSTSYEILSHAVAPVLAYPPRWRPRSSPRVC